jgi:hypothetical protein
MVRVVRTYEDTTAPVATSAVFKLADIVWFIIGLIQLLLGLRLILLFLGASSASPFVSFIYDLSSAFVAPFSGIFPSTNLGGFVVEWASIIAMIAYSIIGWIITKLLSLALPTRTVIAD